MALTDRPAERFRALHYLDGRGACGWLAVEAVSRRLWLYREWAPTEPLGPAAFARGVAERSQGERYGGTWANPEVFAGKPGEPRTCDAFCWAGIDCYPAPGDDETRAARFLDYQEPCWLVLPGGERVESPRLVLTPACTRARQALAGALSGSASPVVLMLQYACISRDPGEGRRVDPDEELLRLAEEGTRRREEARERDRRARMPRRRGR